MSNSETKYQHGDWLYNLILGKAEKYWEVQKRISNEHGKYVLIAERSSERDGHYTGDVVQSWIRDKEGLREISLNEHAKHTDKIHNSDIYPFILMQFYIFPDRQCVIIGTQEASRSGSGGEFIVQVNEGKAKLEPDVHGSFWVS